jgi:hypothetical protein
MPAKSHGESRGFFLDRSVLGTTACQKQHKGLHRSLFMYNKFEDLLSDLKQSRPSQQTPNGPVYFFNDHPVWFGAGEMEGVHWVDIHIELKHFMLDNLNATKKVLQGQS